MVLTRSAARAAQLESRAFDFAQSPDAVYTMLKAVKDDGSAFQLMLFRASEKVCHIWRQQAYLLLDTAVQQLASLMHGSVSNPTAKARSALAALRSIDMASRHWPDHPYCYPIAYRTPQDMHGEALKYFGVTGSARAPSVQEDWESIVGASSRSPTPSLPAAESDASNRSLVRCIDTTGRVEAWTMPNKIAQQRCYVLVELWHERMNPSYRSPLERAAAFTIGEVLAFDAVLYDNRQGVGVELPTPLAVHVKAMHRIVILSQTGAPLCFVHDLYSNSDGELGAVHAMSGNDCTGTDGDIERGWYFYLRGANDYSDDSDVDGDAEGAPQKEVNGLCLDLHTS
jgi:hypothetical protein